MLYKMKIEHNILNRDEAIYYETELQKARLVIKDLFKKRDKTKREKDQAILNLASHINVLRKRKALKSEMSLEVKRKKMSKHIIIEDYEDISEMLQRARFEFNTTIRRDRESRKHKNLQIRNYGTEKFPLSGLKSKGYVHTKIGNFLELKKLKKLKEIDLPKIPKTSDNHIGIEIEFASFLTKNQIAKLFFEEGLLDYVQLQHEYVQGRDNSESEYELCVIAKQDELEDIVQRVCRVLNEKIDANITYGCGLHIHLDARNRSVKKMFDNLFNCQEVLYSMVAHTRRSNKHVQLMAKKQWYPVQGAFAHKKECKEENCTCTYDKKNAFRFYGINTWAYKSHNTMEIRIHSGTSNANKILNWVKVLTNIVDGKDIVKPIKEVEEFCNVLKLDTTLKDYIFKRVENFKVDKESLAF